MAAKHKKSVATFGRVFYGILLALSVLAVISILSKSGQHHGPQSLSSLARRDISTAKAGTKDLECRLVHTAPDKCTFVQANCPDEEAGLFSYLQLYYCKLPNAKPFAFIILIVWLALLFGTIGIAASDFLCINLSTIASLLRMSESLAGVTFLAFGNGSPDVFSTFAAMSSHSGSLAIGELIGAACFISAVVAGSMAIVRPFKVARKSFVRDVGFFVVAAGFSMVFLADGRLHLWECAVMVGFYIFYVIFVVYWHWWLNRRRTIRLREAAARSTFHIPSNQELEVNVEGADDEDEPVANESSALLAGRSLDDFAALEAANAPLWKEEDDADEDEESRERSLAELRAQMRVRRQPRGERRNTINPIRPSLVGALEFRSVLNHLQHSRSQHTIPINLRRYSDDGSLMATLDVISHRSASSSSRHRRLSSDRRRSVQHMNGISTGVRGRAVSANDAPSLRLDTNVLGEQGKRQIDRLEIPREVSEPPSANSDLGTTAPDSSAKNASTGRDSSPGTHRSASPSLLVPPEASYHNPSYQGRVADNPSYFADLSHSGPERHTPQLRSHSPLAQAMSPPAAFPAYTDEPPMASPMPLSRAPSIHLPPPSMSPESVPTSAYPQSVDDDSLDIRKFTWWPYNVLPPPQTIVSAIFPTIYHWHGKSVWDKVLGLLTAPSVFLLTITLPVVEADQPDQIPDPDPGILSPGPSANFHPGPLIVLPPDSPEPTALLRSNSDERGTKAQPASRAENGTGSENALETSPKEWNRWLVSVQLFTAPFFVILILWANTDESLSPKKLLYMTLCSLLFSFICLLVLVSMTSPSKPPKYRPLLCFLGFLVAISWIATIANEVVGVLKAFGVIFGISDAILGLTIFAVGNSLGDLVADITVARLGFPMMALSACFGGPMLNILLGIGVSGMYMTIRAGKHKHDKHPDRPMVYKPYSIDVSTTLIISGVTLLVTLVGLLIVVPLNHWRMDKKIGWGLITLWTLSTVGNVIVEIVVVGKESVA